MVVKEKIKEDLDKYYVLYKYDIKGIFESLHNYPNVLEKIKHYDKEEIKNLIKLIIIFLMERGYYLLLKIMTFMQHHYFKEYKLLLCC